MNLASATGTPTSTGSPPQDPSVSALFNEFTNIDIFSSEDFNGIPAGSSLGPVTELLATTFKPYIESGYKDEFDWVGDIPESYKNYFVGWGDSSTLHPVYGTVAGIDPAELVLVEPLRVCFQFLEEPEIKHHTIYLRFTDKEQVLNCMLEYDFEGIFPGQAASQELICRNTGVLELNSGCGGNL